MKLVYLKIIPEVCLEVISMIKLHIANLQIFMTLFYTPKNTEH